MKKIINYLLVLCLIIPSIFMLTACAKTSDAKALEEIAGTYSYTAYEDTTKNMAECKVEKNGKFALTIKTSSGVTVEEFNFSGTLSVDENKRLTGLTFDNILEAFTGLKKVLGNVMPPVDTTISYEVQLLGDLLGDVVKSLIYFDDGYMILDFADQPLLLYKNGVKKFGKDIIVKVSTEKDLSDVDSSMDILNGKKPKVYDADYYFTVNEYDLTNTTGKADFITELNDRTGMISTDKFGYAKYLNDAIISDVADFDLTTVGTRTATIKYVSNEELVSKTVSYKVVENSDGLPDNQLRYLDVRNNYNSEIETIEYVEKGQELYELGWDIYYATHNISSITKDLNAENCTGNTKVIDIAGYDKNKVGYQLVTVTYRGFSRKVPVFVYDSETNPVVSGYANSSCKVVITATTVGNNTTYAIDYTNAQITLEKADETTADFQLSENNVVDLLALKDYEDGDEIVFAYDYEYENKVYTFYVTIEVEINVA